MRPELLFTLLLIIFLPVMWGKVTTKIGPSSIDQQCFQELGMTQKILTQAFVANFKLSEDNVKAKKFLACVWKKRGYLNDAGEVDTSKVNKLIKNALVDTNSDVDDMVVANALKMCANVRGVDAGDTAVKMHNCIIDSSG